MSFSMQGHIFLMGIYVEMELLESSSCQFWRECQVVFWNTGIPFIVSRSVWEILFPYAFTKSYFWVFKSLQFWWVCQSVQPLSCVRLFVTPWAAAHQASLSINNSQSLLKLMSIELVMPSNQVILCHPVLLLHSIFPSIRVFSNESALRIRWPECWSFSLNISPSNEHPGLMSFRMDWLDLLAVQGLTRVFSNTTVQKHQFFGAQLSL